MNPYEPSSLPLSVIDWTAHVPLIGQANAALARFDGMVQGIVNPEVMLSPLTTQEAVLSSRIEGTQATMQEVMEYEADMRGSIEPSRHADIQEILNYRIAMSRAVEKMKTHPLCLNLVKELHSILLASVRGQDKSPGEFRKLQNCIAPHGRSIEEASFVPPVPERVEKAMDNWERYLHIEERDRLVQLAVAKAQFELIHPFLDGNGRLGRMFIPIFLYEKKILANPVFYLSAYFESNREVYIERLQQISRGGDWNGWIRFFLEAVITQSSVNTDKTRQILNLYERMKRDVPKTVKSQYVIHAIDALFGQPVFTTSSFVVRSGIQKASAIRILSAFKDSGIVRELRTGSGRRAAILSFVELLKITEYQR